MAAREFWLKDVRLSFPDLFEATQVQGQGAHAYRATLLVEASDKQKAEVDKLIKEMATTLLGPSRAGDSAQALMDLGATICTPRLASSAWVSAADGEGEGAEAGAPVGELDGGADRVPGVVGVVAHRRVAAGGAGHRPRYLGAHRRVGLVGGEGVDDRRLRVLLGHDIASLSALIISSVSMKASLTVTFSCP